GRQPGGQEKKGELAIGQLRGPHRTEQAALGTELDLKPSCRRLLDDFQLDATESELEATGERLAVPVSLDRLQGRRQIRSVIVDRQCASARSRSARRRG